MNERIFLQRHRCPPLDFLLNGTRFEVAVDVPCECVDVQQPRRHPHEQVVAHFEEDGILLRHSLLGRENRGRVFERQVGDDIAVGNRLDGLTVELAPLDYCVDTLRFDGL